MKPNIVLVETNWVVDVIAPAHLQSPQALKLLERAEARETLPRRFAPRSRSEDFRKFVRWARDSGRVTVQDAKAAFRIFEQFDSLVKHELAKVPERLEILSHIS